MERFDIIKSLIITEKSSQDESEGKYSFWVDVASNKIEIAKAIEDIYSVKVRKVNTISVGGKKRRIRYKEGKTPDRKKAIVTLKKGEKIDIR